MHTSPAHKAITKARFITNAPGDLPGTEHLVKQMLAQLGHESHSGQGVRQWWPILDLERVRSAEKKETKLAFRNPSWDKWHSCSSSVEGCLAAVVSLHSVTTARVYAFS